MTDIILKIRDLVADILITNGSDTFEYISSKVFVLTSSNSVTSTIKVYKNGTLISSANYTFDTTTSTLTYTGTIAVGNIINITYSYYNKYSDNEIRGYIRSALYHLTVSPYKTFSVRSSLVIFPTPTEEEESLIAIVASILMKGNIRSYKTPEISITFGDESGGTLSLEQKIKQLVRQFVKAYGVLEYVDPSETLYNEENEESEL
jgi:hypothetical protein